MPQVSNNIQKPMDAMCRLPDTGMTPVVETITKPLTLGEGPHWDETTKCLYFVDLRVGRIHRYDPAKEKDTFIDIGNGKEVTLVIPVEGEEGTLIATRGLDLILVKWDGISTKPSCIEVIARNNERCNNRFNDGKVAPDGKLFAGTMARSPDPLTNDYGTFGTLRIFDPSNPYKGFSEPLVTDIGISNGLAWSANQTRFYFVDSAKLYVFCYDYDPETNKLSNLRTVFDFEETCTPGFPDGMTIDCEDKLWVACYNGARVIRIDPDTGKVMKTVILTADEVTSVVFGGEDYKTLYVTTAAVMGNKELAERPDSGKVFKVTNLGVKGTRSRPMKMPCKK